MYWKAYAYTEFMGAILLDRFLVKANTYTEALNAIEQRIIRDYNNKTILWTIMPTEEFV